MNPEIDIIKEVKPLAGELFGDDFAGAGVEGFLEQAKQYLKQFGSSLLKVPTVIDRIESGKLTVKLQNEQVREFHEVQNAGAQRIVRTIIGAVLFFSGIYLIVHPNLEVISWILLVCGALIMLRQTRPIRTSRKRRRRHPGL